MGREVGWSKVKYKVNGVNLVDNDNTIKTLPLSFFAWLQMMQTKARAKHFNKIFERKAQKSSLIHKGIGLIV